MTSALIYHWRLLALRGLLSMFFGVVALLWPGLTVATLVILFGAYCLTDGVFAITAAFRQRERWWALVLEGIAGIGVGVIALLRPGLTALTMLYLIAAWALVSGALALVTAVRLRKVIQGEFLLGLSGVASMVTGVLLFLWPGPGGLALVWLLGCYALVFGALLLALGFRLRRELPPRVERPSGGPSPTQQLADQVG